MLKLLVPAHTKMLRKQLKKCVDKSIRIKKWQKMPWEKL